MPFGPIFLPDVMWFNTYLWHLNKRDRKHCSGKRNFTRLAMSSVLDYIGDYGLLQFMYDQYLCCVITAKKNVAEGRRNPLKNMFQTSSFGERFWGRKTDVVVDMLRQYGVGNVWFWTIAPYEWTFPWPALVERVRDRMGRSIQGLAFLETMHMPHVLEQLLKEWVFGRSVWPGRQTVALSTDARWFQDLLGDTVDLGANNVPCHLFRFEYQEGLVCGGSTRGGGRCMSTA